MAAAWTPKDVITLTIAGSASIGLLALMACIIILVLENKIDVAILGTVKGATTGGGIAVLVAMVTTVMLKGIPK